MLCGGCFVVYDKIDFQFVVGRVIVVDGVSVFKCVIVVCGIVWKYQFDGCVGCSVGQIGEICSGYVGKYYVVYVW